jgi:hypothetical protein
LVDSTIKRRYFREINKIDMKKRHVEKALDAMSGMMIGEHPIEEFIKVINREDIRNLPPEVHFTIQSDPVGDVGVNGCQVGDMLVFVKNLYESLDDAVTCGYNAITIYHISQALKCQRYRTEDRERRGVEGKQEE